MVQEIEPTLRKGDSAAQLLADSPPMPTPAVSLSAPNTIKEPNPTFDLKLLSPPAKKKKTKSPALPYKPSLISDFSPPQGNRNQSWPVQLRGRSIVQTPATFLNKNPGQPAQEEAT